MTTYPMKKWIPCLLALACCGCMENKEKTLQLESDIYRMRKENRQLADDLGKARTDVEVGKASLQRSDAELETLRARQEAARKELEAIRTEFENYKRDFHLQSRLRAVGQKYAELATTEGKTYKDVTIRAVLGDTVQFKHADGTARLPIANLGRSWVKRFDVAPAPPVCSIDDDTLRQACAEAAKAQ